MNLTAKTEFALRMLMDIAFHEKNGPVQRKHIALRQGVPTDYMDQLLLRLRRAGFIHSYRGREGGYHMAMDPGEISLYDIAQAVEDPGYTATAAEPCPEELMYGTEKLTGPAIQFYRNTILRQLKKYTLAQFIEDAEERMLDEGIDPAMLRGTVNSSRIHEPYEIFLN